MKEKEIKEKKLIAALDRWANMIWKEGGLRLFNPEEFEQTGVVGWVGPDEIVSSIIGYIRGYDLRAKRNEKRRKRK